MHELRGKDRLIVALDVPTMDRALGLVGQLDNVSFFKIGWELFIESGMQIVERLQERKVFVDLKIPGDISNTVSRVAEECMRLGVKFMTLSESMPLAAIRAVRAARGDRDEPKLLTVPFLSSLSREDLADIAPQETDLDSFILSRAQKAIAAGCDGVIASGDAIHLCRQFFGDSVVIVSPGIRPAGVSTDDHKRHTTPRRAIESGADYLVVGRPITQSPDPRNAAQRVIEEIDAALPRLPSASGSPGEPPIAFAALPRSS